MSTEADVPEWATCGVCMEVLEDPRPCAACSKNACAACLREWRDKSPTCPFCRYALGALPPLNRGLRDAIHAVVPERLRPPRSPAGGAPQRGSEDEDAAAPAVAARVPRAASRAARAAPAAASPAPRAASVSLLESTTPSPLLQQSFDVALLALAAGAYRPGLALLAALAASCALVRCAPLPGPRESWRNDARRVRAWGARHALFSALLLASAAGVLALGGGAATALACLLPGGTLAVMARTPRSRARAPGGEAVGDQQLRALRLAQGGAALLLLGQWRLVLAGAAALEAALCLRAAAARAGVGADSAAAAAVLALAGAAALLLSGSWSLPLLHFLLLAPLLLGEDASAQRALERLQRCDLAAHMRDVAGGVAGYEAATALPRALAARSWREWA
jgi:hypothetical protein